MSSDPNEEIHLSTDEARSGATPGVTRYVLGISLPLVIVLFLVVWLFAFHHS